MSAKKVPVDPAGPSTEEFERLKREHVRLQAENHELRQANVQLANTIRVQARVFAGP